MEASWTLAKVRLICGSRRDEEQGGGAGPSSQPGRDEEQGGGAGLSELDLSLIHISEPTRRA